jgi:Fic family protein
MRNVGRYEQLGDLKFFIPNPLPPQDPTLSLAGNIAVLYGEAMIELGRLNEVANTLPNAERFIKAYAIKEALLSSSIEGIHTTMLDVFTQPITQGKPSKDTQMVLNYTKALDKALFMIQKDNLPIVSRVFLGAHEALMQLGEGEKFDPGHYRKQSVRVGNITPAPANHVPLLMSELERFINTDTSLPPLIKAGLAHVQFETIHPFLDGNGRIGRLLIVLMLIESGLASSPILYPSYFFKKNHYEYYQRLENAQLRGDFEGWITFYLTAIRDSCIDAYKKAKEIGELASMLSLKISTLKGSKSKLHAFEILFAYPVINVNELGRQLKMSYNTANHIVSDFIEHGLLVEETQQKRGKLFKFKAYIDILEKE